MSIAIIAIIAIIISLIALFVIRHKRAVKVLEQNIDDINKQIVIFNSEYADILKHYIPESEENDFEEKWHDLYSDVSKYHLSNKNIAYAGILQFKDTYKHLQKSISESNAEIKRKEIVKKLLEQVFVFFSELSEITNQYVTHNTEIWFEDKWHELSLQISKTDVRETDTEHQEIDRFKTVYGSLHSFSIMQTKTIYGQNQLNTMIYSQI